MGCCFGNRLEVYFLQCMSSHFLCNLERVGMFLSVVGGRLHSPSRAFFLPSNGFLDLKNCCLEATDLIKRCALSKSLGLTVIRQ